MRGGQRKAARRGTHYELAVFAARKIQKLNFALKAKSEAEYEVALTQSLNSSRKLKDYLITQKESEPVEKITPADVFGFRHRPDLTIGNDGTAIELKVIHNGQAIREALGQALCYRTWYRFVILVLLDLTKDKIMVNRCRDKTSNAYKLLQGLTDMNIFTIVGPAGHGKNIAFLPLQRRATVKRSQIPKGKEQ